MPIDSVLWVEVDSCGEVRDGFVKLEEPVPDKTSTIISRCVAALQSNDLVEVFSTYRLVKVWVWGKLTKVRPCPIQIRLS